MVSVQTIVRRTPYGWETLLVVNGVVGRAEEVLCLEEFIAPPSPSWTKREEELILFPPPLPQEMVDFIDATDRTARSASSAGS